MAGKTPTMVRSSHLHSRDTCLRLRQPEVMAAKTLGADELVQRSEEYWVVNRHRQLLSEGRLDRDGRRKRN